MQKNISINLGGSTFQITEEAYEKLEKYLTSIKEYYKDSEGEEILADIESGLA